MAQVIAPQAAPFPQEKNPHVSESLRPYKSWSAWYKWQNNTNPSPKIRAMQQTHYRTFRQAVVPAIQELRGRITAKTQGLTSTNPTQAPKTENVRQELDASLGKEPTEFLVAARDALAKIDVLYQDIRNSLVFTGIIKYLKQLCSFLFYTLPIRYQIYKAMKELDALEAANEKRIAAGIAEAKARLTSLGDVFYRRCEQLQSKVDAFDREIRSNPRIPDNYNQRFAALRQQADTLLQYEEEFRQKLAALDLEFPGNDFQNCYVAMTIPLEQADGALNFLAEKVAHYRSLRQAIQAGDLRNIQDFRTIFDQETLLADAGPVLAQIFTHPDSNVLTPGSKERDFVEKIMLLAQRIAQEKPERVKELLFFPVYRAILPLLADAEDLRPGTEARALVEKIEYLATLCPFIKEDPNVKSALLALQLERLNAAPQSVQNTYAAPAPKPSFLQRLLGKT